MRLPLDLTGKIAMLRSLISKLGGEHDVVFSCEPTPANQAGHPLSLATSGIGAAFAALSGKPAVVESFGLAGFN